MIIKEIELCDLPSSAILYRGDGFQEVGEGGFRMLVVASRMDEVPGLALLAELIRPDFLSAVSVATNV